MSVPKVTVKIALATTLIAGAGVLGCDEVSPSERVWMRRKRLGDYSMLPTYGLGYRNRRPAANFINAIPSLAD